MSNQNLFSALRAAFPSDLDSTAVETTAADGSPLFYTWRDLDRASARIANLLASLKLPEGSRVAVQVEKSVEAMALYLATLRAGYVFLPLNTAYQSAEIEYFIGNAEPAVVVCSPGNFGWVSKIAFTLGTQHVFTLGDDRTGSLLERAAHHSDEHTPAVKAADDLAAILYTSGTTGRSKGAMLTHGNMLSNAVMLKDYWGWTATGGPDGRGDVLIHALPIFHVHGLFVAIHGALINGSKMIWCPKFDPKAVIAAMHAAGITDPDEQAMLLAQVDHESGGFKRLNESFKYRNAGQLMAVSKTARKHGTAAVEAALASGPEAVAALMYGGRMGNRTAEDAYRYRGRGFIQLTGRDNYARAGKALGLDLPNQPDLAADPAIAARIATWY